MVLELRDKEYAGVWKRRREGREFQEASTCAKVLRREEFQRTQCGRMGSGKDGGEKWGWRVR